MKHTAASLLSRRFQNLNKTPQECCRYGGVRPQARRNAVPLALMPVILLKAAERFRLDDCATAPILGSLHFRKRDRSPPGLMLQLEHDPEKPWPGLDPGWTPVFGKDRALASRRRVRASA